MKKQKKDIIILGAGNVAHALGKELNAKGYLIRGVYSRTTKSARALAKYFSCDVYADPSLIPADASYYLISVTDEALPEVASRIPFTDGIVMHTAGSVPLDVLARFKRYGVLYPLQTLSKNKETDFSIVPLCIEASDKTTLKEIKKIALEMSETVVEVTTRQRKVLHVAAVFACNFSNYMYIAAHDILKQEGMDFKILLPLIIETVEKLMLMDPRQAQTGPAIRGDKSIMQEHIHLLKEMPHYQKIYKTLSSAIAEILAPKKD
jgi:predicted short-subunit dehydrogenase-like oxidoreductase (DUF2520 family)